MVFVQLEECVLETNSFWTEMIEPWRRGVGAGFAFVGYESGHTNMDDFSDRCYYREDVRWKANFIPWECREEITKTIPVCCIELPNGALWRSWNIVMVVMSRSSSWKVEVRYGSEKKIKGIGKFLGWSSTVVISCERSLRIILQILLKFNTLEYQWRCFYLC